MASTISKIVKINNVMYELQIFYTELEDGYLSTNIECIKLFIN